MLLKTHVATALAITYLFDYYISTHSLAYAGNVIARTVIYATSVVLQYLIDRVGHTWRRVGNYTYPVRNKYHSLPVMILIGGVIGVLYYSITGFERLIWLYISVMLLHWLEDLVTESGVYLLGRKVRLPKKLRIRYDNGVANRVAILVGAAISVIYTNPFASITVFVFFMITMMISAYSFLAV